jgi:hypothetical protein
MPSSRPEQPAKRREGDGFAKKEAENGAARCAKRDQQADFAGPFGDGDGHDGDNADAADQQRNAAECANRHGQDIEDVRQRAQHVFLRGDGEILTPVARLERCLDQGTDAGGGTPSSYDRSIFMMPSRL